MMDDSSLQGRLVGSEIHGFRTLKDLDVHNMMEEARSRWLRPNEIHAVLCNHMYFPIHVKPVNLPKSGRMVLFDRKKLRNFRKDGHNWKKKKDGKTVKEAHEHLKVGNEERIHVYYAHGEDNTTFVRRCYWLLDKSLEHIVLVHYRETQEILQESPAHSSPAVSDPSASWPLSEESESVDRVYLESYDNMTVKNHEQTLHEINTLEWDELLMTDDPNNISPSEAGTTAGFGLSNPNQMNKATTSVSGGESIGYNISSNLSNETVRNEAMSNLRNTFAGSIPFDEVGLLQNQSTNGLQTQDSFGRWMTRMIADSPDSVDNQSLDSSVLTGHQPITSSMMDNNCSSTMGQIFNITDISPGWSLSNEETKILIVGFFNSIHLPRSETNVFLACGDSILQTEVVQTGVFRAIIPPQNPGLVNIYLTFDGNTPISQVLTFDFRAPKVPNKTTSLENKSNWEEYQLQMRLARLLFSSSRNLDIFSSKISQSVLKEAKTFSQKTAQISQGWLYLIKMFEGSKLPLSQAKDSLLEVILQNRLQEWLLEKMVSGAKISERDEQGQDVIHLCAILGYTWAVYPFLCSGLSLDFRDKFGWTALHWAAYHGREKMVAALLSAGAKPNLVTDPTSDNPAGCNAADLASLSGYDGLSAYLAEKALVAQLNEMTLAGNVSGSLQTTTNETVLTPGNFTEDELYLKDTLAAYRTAADAAARIQTAFREHSLKVRTKVVESSNPEIDARNIVAAMKIQHAFRNYDTKKKMAAAARIQYRFRTWKMRKDFLNMRRKAIKIQAAFRGFQVRRQYRKICWSVGVLEKAILRWRLKRKGFRGLQVQSNAAHEDPNNESDVEEDFFRASRKQAEERVERSVVRVQAMFRSKKAQEEYRRMKLEHNQAKLEFEGLFHHDTNMS